jgi:hypothetical protein
MMPLNLQQIMAKFINPKPTAGKYKKIYIQSKPIIKNGIPTAIKPTYVRSIKNIQLQVIQ